MSLSIALLLGIIAVAMVLLSLDRLPTDVTVLGIMLALVLCGLIDPAEALAGFGSNAVALIFGLLVLTSALVRTGVVDTVGRAILRLTGDSHKWLLWAIMLTAAAISAVMSNTAATALLVPVALGLAHRRHISASKLLLPLAFSSILASSVTLVSSSTNIVISDLVARHGLDPLGMFELSLVGLPIAVVGLVYLALLGRRLVPDRLGPDEAEEPFIIRPYLAEIVILPDSPLVGKTLLESGLGRDLDLTVLRILRRSPAENADHYLAPRAGLQLRAGDELLVKGQHDSILQVKEAAGIGIKADVQLSDPRLQAPEVMLVEVILMPRSRLVGHTLKGRNVRDRYGLQVLGINRGGRNMYRKLSAIPLRVGDRLLVQGQQATIRNMDRENLFQVLGTVDYQRPDRKRAPIAAALFCGVLVLAASNLVSLPIAALLGVLGAFLTHCITPEQAYREVEWKAIIVVGCMLALGSAMEQTGAAQFVASQIAAVTGTMHAYWLLSAFFCLTMLLTQPMSNQAAAVVVLPVAIQAARQLGLNPRTFAIMIAVGASCSFLTPLEPSCLIVYGPGRYRFMDFLKVGLPLTVLVYLIAIAIVPVIWPL